MATVHGGTESRSDTTEPLSTAQHGVALCYQACSWNINVTLHYSKQRRSEKENKKKGEGEEAGNRRRRRRNMKGDKKRQTGRRKTGEEA